MANIVKRQNKIGEPYDPTKLLNSLVKSCQSVGSPIGAAEDLAKMVCKKVELWLQNKHEVTSLDIRLQAYQHLSQLHPEAAYVYQNDRIID